jgi:putative ABC transport system permease protein
VKGTAPSLLAALTLKFLRDLWRIRGQALAISLVVAAGVGTFTMSLSTLASLHYSLDTYYDRARFGDVFVHLQRAPISLASVIEDIDGVVAVQARVVVGVTLDVEGLPEPATGRIISIDIAEKIGLNQLYLRKGRLPTAHDDEEVLVSEGFARVHRLEPGSQVRAVLNGRLKRLTVVGVALSPEYVYQFREGDVLPDDRRFGVFWMDRQALASAFDLDGAFNDVVCLLSPNAREDDVVRQLDRLTEQYGGRGAYGRSEQASHKFVTNEMAELRGMAMVTPTIFLSVMAFLMHVVIGRLVETQREQIAILKAFGYGRLRISLHFAAFSLVIVVVGVGLGTVLGVRLGYALTGIYTRFFHFPSFHYELAPWIPMTAGGVSLTAALLGTIHAVARSVARPPAEAMQPPAPVAFKATLIERIGLSRWMSPTLRMILRRMERHWFRVCVTCVGIAMAVSVLILGSFIVDAVEYSLESQFEVAQRQDLHITLTNPKSSSVLFQVRHLPGVRYCEGFRSCPVRIGSLQRSRRLSLLGLPASPVLHQMLDVRRRVLELPKEGVVLSRKLAEVLGVGMGGTVEVELLEGDRRIFELPVAGLIDDFAGTAAYIERETLNCLLGEGNVINGAFLSIDTGRIDELYKELKLTPAVMSVVIKGATVQSFRDTVAENILRVRMFNSMFATILAIGVIYNSARISLAEQSRDLATLRILGLTRREVANILFGELLLVVAAGIPIGLLMGKALSGFVIKFSYDTELFRIPLIIESSTYSYAVAITLMAMAASALIIREIVDRLDIVSVLKHKG